LVGVLATVAAADSITNCGSSTDHLVITSVTLDADATGGPRKGKPFTITAEGVLDEDHVSGSIVGDCTLQALGIVNDEPVVFNQKYDYSPGLPAGNVKLTIGPFTFPRALPGVFDFSGKINVVNDKAEPVACLDVAFHIPKILSEEEQLTSSEAECGDMSADHITNIQTVTDATGVSTTTMDSDSDIGYTNLGVDIVVKVPLLPGVSVNLPELPISLEPAVPAGQLKFVGYPEESSTPSNSAIDVTGTLTLGDINGEELTCITFGEAAAAVSV
jgi:hypothetical protein